MPKFPKNTGFRMKGYSYPGESPNKQVSDYKLPDVSISGEPAYGPLDPKDPKFSLSKNKETDPNIDKYKSGWDMDWGKALKTLLSSGLSKKGIMKALGQGLKVPSGKRKDTGTKEEESTKRTVEDIKKNMEEITKGRGKQILGSESGKEKFYTP